MFDYKVGLEVASGRLACRDVRVEGSHYNLRHASPTDHGIVKYPLLYYPHPKMKLSFSLMWALFWDGGGIEGGSLEGYDLSRAPAPKAKSSSLQRSC